MLLFSWHLFMPLPFCSDPATRLLPCSNPQHPSISPDSTLLCAFDDYEVCISVTHCGISLFHLHPLLCQHGLWPLPVSSDLVLPTILCISPEIDSRLVANHCLLFTALPHYICAVYLKLQIKLNAEHFLMSDVSYPKPDSLGILLNQLQQLT